jgi:hypothetical protein
MNDPDVNLRRAALASVMIEVLRIFADTAAENSRPRQTRARLGRRKSIVARATKEASINLT